MFEEATSASANGNCRLLRKLSLSMLGKLSLMAAGAVGLLLPLPAPAASSLQGSVTTNPGAKYVPYGGSVSKFHTNPGGKYIYRGSGRKFHTNPGGKYLYPGWSSAPH
jgi:hypothetical protein